MQKIWVILSLDNDIENAICLLTDLQEVFCGNHEVPQTPL